jgi:hypothetical protein
VEPETTGAAPGFKHLFRPLDDREGPRVVPLAVAVFAWWRAYRRTMSSRMNRAKGKMNRAVGKAQGRFG